MSTAAPLPTWLIREKRYGRWTFHARATTRHEALALARACGLTEPATITEEQPSAPVTTES